MDSFFKVLLFSFANVSLLFGSSRISNIAFPNQFVERSLATVILFIAKILIIQQFFGILGFLRADIIYSAAIVLGLAEVIFLRRFSEEEKIGIVVPKPIISIPVFLATFFVLVVFVLSAKDGLFLPPIEGDSMAYHLPNSVWMLNSGQMKMGMLSYYPANAELLTVWLMLPFGSDLFANFQNVLPLLIFFLSFLSLCNILGVDRPIGYLFGCILLLSVKPIFKQMITQENDLFLASFWLSSVAMLGHWITGRRMFHLFLAGLSIGIVLGTKYSGVAYLMIFVFLLIVFSVFKIQKSTGWRSVAMPFFVAIMSSLLMGIYFYIRNWIYLGSPFFPSGLKVFGINVFPRVSSSGYLFAKTVLANYIFEGELWKLLFSAFIRYGGWASIFSIIALPIFCLKYRKTIHKFVGIAAILAFLVLLVTPFAAENVEGTLNQLRGGYSPVRFGLPFLGIAFVSLTFLVLIPLNNMKHSEVVIHSIMTLVIALVGVQYFAGLGKNAVLIFVCLILAALLFRFKFIKLDTIRCYGRYLQKKLGSLSLYTIFSTVFFFLLLFSRLPLESRRANARSMVYGKALNPNFKPTKLYKWCDEKIDGKTVWITGCRLYPFYGRRFTNKVLPCSSASITEMIKSNTQSKTMEYGDWPDYIIVGAGSGDPYQRGYGTYPVWEKSLLQSNPQLFSLVFQDHIAHVYKPVFPK